MLRYPPKPHERPERRQFQFVVVGPVSSYKVIIVGYSAPDAGGVQKKPC